jgi:Tetratricopeptide repeat
MNRPVHKAIDPTRRGNLASMSLPELLIALLDARKTGSLRIQRPDGICDTVMRIEDGVPVGIRMPGLGPSLLQSLVPLCMRNAGDYVFVEGQDDVGSGPGAAVGRVDPLTLIAAAVRGPVREDALATTLAPLATAVLHLSPRLAVARYAFTEVERGVVDALVREPRTLIELCMQPGLNQHVARRVVYVLAVTRGLTASAGERRMVSGTIEQVSPPQHGAVKAEPAAFEGTTSRMRAPSQGSYRMQRPELGETTVTMRDAARAGDKSARITQADVHRNEADRLLQRSDYTAAAQQAQKAFKLDGSARSESLFAYLLHLSCGDTSRVHPRVSHMLDRALQREPDCIDACFYKGLVLRHGGQHDDASRYFRRVLRLQPNHAAAQQELRLWETRQASQGGFVAKLLSKFPSGRPKP